jgi:hypothetical protein
MGKPPGLSRGVSAEFEAGLDVVKRRADVLEQLADDRAKEDQGHDDDDRDQGEQQTVLNERLALLIVALETSQKIADEKLHVFWDLLSEKICSESVWAPFSKGYG